MPWTPFGSHTTPHFGLGLKHRRSVQEAHSSEDSSLTCSYYDHKLKYVAFRRLCGPSCCYGRCYREHSENPHNNRLWSPFLRRVYVVSVTFRRCLISHLDKFSGRGWCNGPERLRADSTPAEDQSVSQHSSSRESETDFWPLWVPIPMCTFQHKHTHVHIIKRSE